MTDLLAPLIDAYRAENSPASLDTRALRSRILVAAARRQQNPLRRLRFLLVPLAAAFLATGALAATPSTHPALVRVLANLARAFRSPAPPPLPRAPHRAPAPGTPTLSPHPDLPHPPTESPALVAPASSPLPTPSAPLPTPVAARPPSSLSIFEFKEAIAPRTAPASASASTSTSASASPHSRPPAPPPPPLPPPAPDLSPDLSAYGVAHRLHFTNADFPRALTAWSGYLARFPTGTFAPEARLNRAVCLARLGRTAEARSALTKIANGTYGAYGRAQAQQLLDALSGER